MMRIRFVTEADAPALLAIYAQYIDTPTTFETRLPSEPEFRGRIRAFGAFYPYLVAEEAGRILGYAYAHRQKEREAYRFNAELTVYLDRNAVSHGLGKRLAGAVLALLTMQGVKSVYSYVTMPNEKSRGLHRALGFERTGLDRNTGYKCGAWHDVACYSKALGDFEGEPREPISIGELDAAAVQAILDAAGRLEKRDLEGLCGN